MSRTWRTFAECRPGSTHDPELFFPVGTSGPAQQQAAEAKKVCDTCPVAAFCLQQALQNGETGVWGGTWDEERAQLRASGEKPMAQKIAGLLVRAPLELLEQPAPAEPGSSTEPSQPQPKAA